MGRDGVYLILLWRTDDSWYLLYFILLSWLSLIPSLLIFIIDVKSPWRRDSSIVNSILSNLTRSVHFWPLHYDPQTPLPSPFWNLILIHTVQTSYHSSDHSNSSIPFPLTLSYVGSSIRSQSRTFPVCHHSNPK